MTRVCGPRSSTSVAARGADVSTTDVGSQFPKGFCCLQVPLELVQRLFDDVNAYKLAPRRE